MALPFRKFFAPVIGPAPLHFSGIISDRAHLRRNRMMTRAALGRRTERRRGVGGRGVEDPLLLFFLSIETVLRRTQIATTFTWLTTQTKKAITIKVICILWSFVVNHVNDITQLKV